MFRLCFPVIPPLSREVLPLFKLFLLRSSPVFLFELLSPLFRLFRRVLKLQLPLPVLIEFQNMLQLK
ncbi:hypothetical protein S245_000004 [Arachis hypogaea]